MSFPTPHSRWRALTTRDPSAKHSFIYSVLTTHIYCRPTCPSRLARRANIVFHDSAAAAEADGFRACKRCRPDSGAGTGGGGEETVLARACRIMRDEKCVRGRELAERVGVSESALYRLFRRGTGCTPGEWRRRMEGEMSMEWSGDGGGDGREAVDGRWEVDDDDPLRELEAWMADAAVGSMGHDKDVAVKVAPQDGDPEVIEQFISFSPDP